MRTLKFSMTAKNLLKFNNLIYKQQPNIKIRNQTTSLVTVRVYSNCKLSNTTNLSINLKMPK